MIEIKYLFELQYIIHNDITQRVYLIASSQDDISRYVENNNLTILHQKIIASNLGDPGAKGNDITLLKDITDIK